MDEGVEDANFNPHICQKRQPELYFNSHISTRCDCCTECAGRSVSRQGQHFFHFFTCYSISLIITFLCGMDSLHYFQYFNLMTSCRQLSGNSRIGITPSYSDQTLCLEVSLSETASSPQSSQPLLQPDQNRSNLFSRIRLTLRMVQNKHIL